MGKGNNWYNTFWDYKLIGISGYFKFKMIGNYRFVLVKYTFLHLFFTGNALRVQPDGQAGGIIVLQLSCFTFKAMPGATYLIST